MADYSEDFKTTLMGGYDKDDVSSRFKALKEAHEQEKKALNDKIEELGKTVEERDAEISKLRRDISEKYQSYIDNYDTIGKIVYETRINSDKTLAEAQSEKDRIIAEADAAAKEKMERAQGEVNKTLADGKRRYESLQDEINELIMLVNQVQHKFMKSFKAIHEISNSMADDPYSGIESDGDDNLDDYPIPDQPAKSEGGEGAPAGENSEA